MLIGHVGIAIGALGLRRTLPLWLLIVAAQLPDWTDASLCLAGIRSTIPGEYSHSFAATGMLALLGALATLALTRDRRGSLLVAAVVVSHTLADYVTGTKPTWPGGPIIGLGLYAKPALDFALEGLVILGGWLVYRRSIPVERRMARPVIAFLLILLALQLAADVIFHLFPGMTKC